MICQQTTKAVVYCFTKAGFFADVYLDDFHGADTPARAPQAFQNLKDLLHELGLQTSPDKDCPPSTNMVCLGVEVDSEHFTLSVTAARVQDLLTELAFWSSREFYTLKQLKSLLAKLSFVAACVKPGRIFMSRATCIKPGRIFMSRLLNNLRAFHASTHAKLRVSADMQADIDWWLAFLPLFNVSGETISNTGANFLNLHIDKATKTCGDKQLYLITHFTKQTLNLNYFLLTLNVTVHLFNYPKTEKAILFLNLNSRSMVVTVVWFTFNLAVHFRSKMALMLEISSD